MTELFPHIFNGLLGKCRAGQDHSIFKHLKMLSFWPEGPGALRTGTRFDQMHCVTSHSLLISGARVQFSLTHRVPTEDRHQLFRRRAVLGCDSSARLIGN
jgi:hypothetical protein